LDVDFRLFTLKNFQGRAFEILIKFIKIVKKSMEILFIFLHISGNLPEFYGPWPLIFLQINELSKIKIFLFFLNLGKVLMIEMK